jgi:peptide/nickel transport system permease protein
MRRFLLQRVVRALLTLAILSVVIFLLARATGDPLTLILPPEASAQDRANLAEALGLDRPLVVQYVRFVAQVATGDFGISLYHRQPVNELIAERLPNSMRLAGFAMTFAILLAFPLGVLAAAHKDTAIDRAAQVIAILGHSLPTFWMGVVLIELLASRLHWFPPGDIGGISHYILPGFTLGWFVVAGMMRLLRSSMIETLDAEFVKLARIKGVGERSVVWLHALKNALVPVVTFMGMYFAILVANAIVVETVFAWPGMGRLAYEAITTRDFPVIQAVVLVAALIVTVANLAVDALYVLIDPRIRYAG